MSERTRWKITVAYHGADFVGWQVQPQGVSVQRLLEDALARLLQHPATVHASGRTDAGVHALGQVAHFDALVPRSPKAIRDGLNAYLPAQVAVLDAEVVPPDFDARRWVLRKVYRYRWLDRPARCPHRHDRVWWYRRRLDAAAMHTAAMHLVGRHDFSSFRAAGCAAAHAVRTVVDARVERVGDEVQLHIVGNGFLRHMVRIVAGTLTDVGRGRTEPARLAEILAARDRTAAGRTAPAHGLALVRVDYGDRARPWSTPEPPDAGSGHAGPGSAEDRDIG